MVYDGYPVDWMRELKDRNNIVEVVSRYVPLTQKGNRFWGNCPFHHEKTPSFTVNEEGYYHCFGCGAGGDVISFLMKYENLTFPEAVNMLAEKAGMQVPNATDAVQINNTRKKRDRLIKVMTACAQRYYQNLMDAERGKQARAYLQKRGFTSREISRFGLGYAVSRDDTIQFLRAQGFSDMEIAESGVGTANSKGGIYDALTDRLIVPIINAMGQVVAFGGRVLVKSDDAAKYRNTTNTLLFEKNKTLFGINLVKKQKQKEGLPYVIIVEGYMDVIALSKGGFNNAVAGMGTALGKGQARDLKNLSKKVYVCYDGDSAGQTAALRNLEILHTEGPELYVVTLPEGDDPDDVIKKGGAQAFSALIDSALPYIEYRLKVIADSNDLTSPAGRAKYVREALEFLKILDNAAEREAYFGIVSQNSRVVIDTLRRQMDEDLSQMPDEVQTAEPKGRQVLDGAAATAAQFVLYALLNGFEYASAADISADYFTDDTYAALAKYILECGQRGEKPVIHMAFTVAADDEKVTAVLDNVDKFQDETLAVQFYRDSIKVLKTTFLENKLSVLSKLYDGASDEERADIAKELLKHQAELAKVKRGQ